MNEQERNFHSTALNFQPSWSDWSKGSITYPGTACCLVLFRFWTYDSSTRASFNQALALSDLNPRFSWNKNLAFDGARTCFQHKPKFWGRGFFWDGFECRLWFIGFRDWDWWNNLFRCRGIRIREISIRVKREKWLEIREKDPLFTALPARANLLCWWISCIVGFCRFVSSFWCPCSFGCLCSREQG